MTLGITEKKQIVEETHNVAINAVSTVVTDYRGLSVLQITEMRRNAREQGVKLQVIRNTLARLALKDTSHECLIESIVGPTMLAFSPSDPGSGARLIKTNISQGMPIEVRAISVAGTLCQGDQLESVAALPTREEALVKLMSVMIGPVRKAVQTLHEIPSKLVRTLDAIRMKKDSD